MAINLTQKFVFENDSLRSIVAVAKAVVPVFMHGGTAFCSSNIPGSWDLRELSEDGAQGGLFLCGFEKYPSDDCNKEDLLNSEQVIARIETEILGFNPDRLAELPAAKFEQWFDGSVGVGFRLESLWDRELWLSVVKIYYGK